MAGWGFMCAMKILFILIIVIAGFVALIRFVEYTSVFYPARPLAGDPADIGLPFEDVYLTTADHVRIHGWLVRSPDAKATLIYLHGNAGNIGDRVEKVGLFHQIDLNVLIIDYRGYGKSQGRPTEQGIYADALSAYDYLKGRPDLKDQKVIVYGSSIGGAVAVDLASKKDIDGLIIDSSFTSAADMAKTIYPFLPAFLLKTKLDSINKIGKISVPKLFLHSPEDEVVPYALGRKLYDAAPEPKRFFEIIGGHNEGHLHDEDKIQNGIAKFLKEQNLI